MGYSYSPLHFEMTLDTICGHSTKVTEIYEFYQFLSFLILGLTIVSFPFLIMAIFVLSKSHGEGLLRHICDLRWNRAYSTPDAL